MLTPADRELVGIGASIGAGCQSCLEYHLDAGSRVGLGEADLLKAIEDAECVRRSASGQLSAIGRQRLGQAAELPADCCDSSDRAKELAAVGASVAANSQANVDKHLAAAKLIGLGTRELEEAVRLARAVQRRSAEILAEDLTRLLSRPAPMTAEAVAVATSCGPDCGCMDESASGGLPVIAGAAATTSCGPDCGCEGDSSGRVPFAAAVTAPGASACACGCS